MASLEQRVTPFTFYMFLDMEDADNFSELNEMYRSKVEQHNEMVYNNKHPDSGFDLFVPQDNSLTHKLAFNGRDTYKIDFKVKTKMVNNTTGRTCGFYMYPRSSISKTPLRMANNVGIIDSGYRGNLIGMFDTFSNELTNANNDQQLCSKYDRLIQICSSTLETFNIVMVNSLEELGGQSTRGEGGIGSTGASH